MTDGGAIAEKTGDTADLDDRQRYPRTAVYCAAKLAAAGRAWDCEILDISAGGAKVRFPTTLDPAAELSLTIGSHGTVPVRLVWQSGQYLGVAFLCDPAASARLARNVIEAGRQFDPSSDRIAAAAGPGMPAWQRPTM